MINEYEKNFISKFVVKNRQDRLIYELSSKKRKDGIGRFCHDIDNLIKHDKIIAQGKICKEDILLIIKKYNVNSKWYIISYNEYMDKKICELDEALQLVLGNGMAAIITSLQMTIIETEQCCGMPERYILSF